jgi:hypothetical protein
MKLKKYNLFGIIFLGILILMSTSSLVSASDDDNDGVDDEFEELHKRDISIEFESNQIQIESSMRNGAQKDEIQLKIVFESEGLSIEISYESEMSSENSTEFEIEFEVTFRKLIEFVDLDDDRIFNPSVDDIIQEVPLDSFQPVVYTPINISDDTSLHYFIVNTTDGVFAAHIYLVEEFEIVNGTFIKPTQMKIDIEITDFDYINSSSQLALYTKLESEVEYEDDEHTENEEDGYATDEKGVIASNNDYAGFFTWTENASIDGVSKEVLGSPIQVDDDDENEQKLYLNYPRGNHIYHDPVMGVMVFPEASVELPILVIISIVSSVGIGGAILIVVLRRRRNIELI